MPIMLSRFILFLLSCLNKPENEKLCRIITSSIAGRFCSNVELVAKAILRQYVKAGLFISRRLFTLVASRRGE